VLQCVAVRCSALQCVAVRCSALQCFTECCNTLQCVAVLRAYQISFASLQIPRSDIAACCSQLQSVVACCRVFNKSHRYNTKESNHTYQALLKRHPRCAFRRASFPSNRTPYSTKYGVQEAPYSTKRALYFYQKSPKSRIPRLAPPSSTHIHTGYEAVPGV